MRISHLYSKYLVIFYAVLKISLHVTGYVLSERTPNEQRTRTFVVIIREMYTRIECE